MSSARDLPAFEYHCSRGHRLGADHPVERCPVVARGVPCPGHLERVGRGSRKAKRAEAVAA